MQLATHVETNVGAGGTDREVLTAGFIPDGMNYMMVNGVRNLALHLDRWRRSMAGGLGFMVDGHQTMVLVDSKRLVYSGWSGSCVN